MEVILSALSTSLSMDNVKQPILQLQVETRLELTLF